MARLSDQEIAEIKERLALSTPGTWIVSTKGQELLHSAECMYSDKYRPERAGYGSLCWASEEEDETKNGDVTFRHDAGDKQFIAHAHQDIPRLLADRESLLQQVETAREEGRRQGLEEAARAAEFYATTNLEMAGDTVLHDPAFRPGPKDWAKSNTLAVMGCIHSAKHEAGNQIAANVRASLQGDQPK